MRNTTNWHDHPGQPGRKALPQGQNTCYERRAADLPVAEEAAYTAEVMGNEVGGLMM
jgi:hypothetical protein